MRAGALQLRLILVPFVVFGLGLVACGDSDSAGDMSGTTTTAVATTTKPAEASTTPTPRTTIEVLRLTFDGESCVYEGPTVLTPGPVQLVFVNEGQDYAAAVGLEILDEGKTFQDYIDHIGPEPSSERAPAWAHGLGTWKRIKVGDSQMWEGDLEPGLYGILCQELSAPSGIWLGSTLTVEE